MKPSVELSIGDGVARVTLSRPDRGNAVDLALAEDLRAALVSARADAGAVDVDVGAHHRGPGPGEVCAYASPIPPVDAPVTIATLPSSDQSTPSAMMPPLTPS